MKTLTWLAAALLLAASGVGSAADAPGSWDGLVEVKARKMDAAFLLPGADFRPYSKLMLDPTEVAFRKDWLRDMNDSAGSLSRQVTPHDAEEILSAARSNFDDIFAAAFTKAGYQIVTAAGPDVLRIRTGVLNLYLNAPDLQSAGRSRSFTANAGEATLVIEVRDSMTGALMGRVVDRRETRDTGMQMASRVTNLSDFRALFKEWASASAAGLEQLKALSPVPLDLKPGQKL
jgi:hypothetical protein